MNGLIEWISPADHQLFHLVNRVWTNFVLDMAMPFITEPRNTVYLLLLLAALLLWRHRLYGIKALLACILSVGITDMVASKILKPAVGRSRPEFSQQDVRLLVRSQGSPSFPSNHAGNCFAAATTLSAFFPGLKLVAFTIASAVAYSRVYVGVHYPLDVLAGALLGIAIGMMVFRIFSAVNKRKGYRK